MINTINLAAYGVGAILVMILVYHYWGYLLTAAAVYGGIYLYQGYQKFNRRY